MADVYLVKLLGEKSKKELPLQFLNFGIFAEILLRENAKLPVKMFTVLCQIQTQIAKLPTEL